MNGRANCILEVCCAPNSERQREALAAELLESGVLETGAEPAPASRAKVDRERIAEHVATWIAETFDLAPKGSLVAFKAEIARLAREPRDH